MSKQEVQDSVGWPLGAELGGALGETGVTSSALPKTHLPSVRSPSFTPSIFQVLCPWNKSGEEDTDPP